MAVQRILFALAFLALFVPASAQQTATGIEEALERVPDEHRVDLEFLAEHMPDHDRQALTADFLLDNVRLAQEALAAAPWGESVPRDVYLNALLPYANVNERRDDWRADFRERFLPVVKDCATPTLAAAKLNQTIWKALNVRYSTKRPKADQSPYESIEASMASCTGLSILLIDACRAVGVPARFVGTPLWSDNSGNHSWVEVWDDGWHFTGAAEPTGDELNQGWFLGKAAKAQPAPSPHGVYAISYRKTPLSFPVGWRDGIDYLYAVDVTERYAGQAEPIPEGMAEVRIRVLESAGGKRVPANVIITDPADGTTLFVGTAKDERFDGNDHLTAILPIGKKCRINVHFHGRILRLPSTVQGDMPVVSIDLSTAPPLVSTTWEPPQDDLDGTTLHELQWWATDLSGIQSPIVLPDQLLQKHPAAARDALWSRHRLASSSELWGADFAADRVTFEEHVSPYTVKEVGERPEKGWPLFIAMHGGGGAPKELNDSQWRHMQIYYEDQPDLGGYKYLALRAPNNTWNGFYDLYVLPLLGNLIRQFLAFGDVDPDKVFLMGYSHGGYGAFYLGPKMADRFAAVHTSAAAPTDDHAAPDNLRNTRFSVMVGELDNAYGRRERCIAFAEQMKAVMEGVEDPKAFPFTFELMEGYPHSGLPDRGKIRDMYDAVRDPLPRHLTWKQTDATVKSFSWLHTPQPKKGARIEAIRGDNSIELFVEGVDEVHVLLDERMIDFDRPVEIVLNSVESKHDLTPSVQELIDTLDERGDPRLAFTARIKLRVPKK